MAKADVLAIASPGSRALKNAKYERYCRLRASAQPRIAAYREAGFETSDDNDAYSNGCRLERRREIKDRIGYLSRQEEDLILESAGASKNACGASTKAIFKTSSNAMTQ